MQAVDIEKLNRDNFRAMMNALSMPGSVEKVSSLFNSDLLALANTLLYSEVSYFYEGSEEFELIDAITNAKKSDLKQADYIFCDNLDEFALNQAKVGTSKDPEFSATLIYKCKSFEGKRVRLSGPGVNESIEVELPIDESFVKFFEEKNVYYPLGNEVFFLNENSQITAISRTTKVEVL